MANFTLHDLAARVKERAQASADVSYTRKLLDRGIAHCAKKLGEEAVETTIAAIAEDRDRAGRRDGRSPLPPAGGAGRRAASRSPRSKPCWPSAPPNPASTRRPGARATAPISRRHPHGPARRTAALALSHLLARRMGVVARRHADDARAGRDRPAALAQRPARHRRGRGNLPAAVAAPVDVRGGDAAPVRRAAALPRHRGRQDAVHHRRRRLGGGRQVDHRARAAGAARALAQCAQGRSRHHRRLSLSQRHPGTRRPDGEEGLSGELRPHRRCCASCPTSRRATVRPARRSTRI